MMSLSDIPGLIDIKDVVFGDNFIAVLSGIRDSVYIFDKNNLLNVFACFNIGKHGNLEFFKERQTQCQEILSNYFQVFYCPAMNNYHHFDQLKLLPSGELSIISRDQNKYININLSNFNYYTRELS